MNEQPTTLQELLSRRVSANAPLSTEQLVQQTLGNISRILHAKNADYGDAFHKRFEKYGMLSALIRLEDKMNRLDNLISNDVVANVNETLEDTLYDLVGYGILTIVELEKLKRQ